MKKLLRIDASPRGEHSLSKELADNFEKRWKEIHPTGKVIYRNLAEHSVPHLSFTTITAFYTSPSHLDEKQQQAISDSDELVSELKNADEILISSPLYNFNVPSNLKAYFDQVVRIGHTFAKNENGEQIGLLKNTTATIITTKGGVYHGTAWSHNDFQEPYLKAILGYMGIKTKAAFSLEGAGNPELLAKNKKLILDQINHSLKTI